jgi:hypothetical protein
MNPLLEGIVANLVSSLIGELAGSARRRLSGDPVQNALKEAVAEALEAALEESGLSPEDCERYADSLGKLFRQEKVLSELSPLLDPRPDLSLDLDRLARELKDAGLDLRGLPGFDLKAFLSRFAFAFYSAVGRQDALRDLLDLKLVGRMVNHLGSIARSSDRTAVGVERIAESVEGLRRELPGFVAGSVSDAAFQGLIVGLTAAGLIPAFDAFRLIETTVHEAGYDLDIDPEGRVRIAGQPPEGRALPPARLNALEKVAITLRRAVQDQQPSAADLNALAERYRLHVVRWFQHLSFHGMTPSAQAILLPLEEVYVELRAVTEVPEAADSFSVEERRLLLEVDDKDSKTRDELLRQLDVLRRERWGRSIPERKSIAAALYQRDQRAFVILGDPGSGKSTLLHFLALVHARGAETAAKRLEIDPTEADRLPIFVSLAAFDDMLRETPGLTLLEFLPRYYDRRRGLPGLGPLFRRALETGRALVLLDGLDEVLDAGTRGYVAQQAGALIGEWSPRGVRFAVSSRFVGYREAPVQGNLPILSVLDFGEKEIEVFVHRWSHAYETWAAGEATPEALRKARELERDLLDDIRSNDSVRRLAANPLMLTLLALLRRQVGKLPHRRVQLYEAYVSTMLDNWLAARSQGAREKSLVALDRHQAENILIPMALWLQREKPSGTAGRAELESTLTEICLKEKGYVRETATLPQLREAEEHARRFLREMREMTGLLVARGYDAFGFLHLTFQEYFAGRGLALLGADERWEVLHPHLHDPRWREPILLCAGRLGVAENRRKEVTDFVHRILNSPDSTESHLHRNLLLALAIACDDVNLDPAAVGELIEAAVRCLPTNVYAFAEVLSGFLARLVADGAPGASLERCFKPLWEYNDEWLRVITLRSLGRFAGKAEIRDLLMGCLENKGEFETVRMAAVKSLAGYAGEPAVRNALLNQLEDQSIGGRGGAAIRSISGLLREDSEVREIVIAQLASPFIADEAARTLASVVREDLEIRAAVIAEAKAYRHYSHRGLVLIPAVSALSELVSEDAEVRAMIIDLLESGSFLIRYRVARLLSEAALRDTQVQLVVLRKINDPAIRSGIFDALSLCSGVNEEIDSVLLRGLRDDDVNIRLAAIQAIGLRAGSDKSIRGILVETLKEPSEKVRMATLRALAPYVGLPELQIHFLALVNSESWSIRQKAAQILGESSGLQESLQALLQIREKVEAPEAERLLSAALESLGSVQGGRDFILAKLKDSSAQVRAAALWALSGFVATDAEARRIVLDRLRDEALDVRSSAFSALSGAIAIAEVRRTVLGRIEDEDSVVRSSALLALSDAVGVDAEVRRAVLDRLGDEEPEVCSSALAALSGAVGMDAEVRRAVLDSLWDEDPDVRNSALSALSGAVGIDADVRQAVLDRLRDKVPIVRSAALSALSEMVENDSDVRRAVLDRLKDKFPIVRSAALSALSGVVENDSEVRRAVLDRLGDKEPAVRSAALRVLSKVEKSDVKVRRAVLIRLKDRDENVRAAAVSALSGLLGADEDLQKTVVSLLYDRSFSVRVSAVRVLLSLTTSRPELWSHVVTWISSDSGKYENDWDARQVQRVLASVLGPRLPEDPQLTEWVLERLGDVRWSSRLGAVLSVLAWPGGPPPEILDRIFKAVEDRRGLESYPARLTAASFLINRNEDGGASIKLCLEALDYGTQPWEALRNSAEIRKQAALVLGKLEPLEENQRVYDRLLHVLKEDKDPDVRDAAYNALVRLAGVRDRRAARA